MSFFESVKRTREKASVVIRFSFLIIILAFVISFCILNTQTIIFHIPLVGYQFYAPACLVIFISPIILKILYFILSLLMK